MSIKKIISIVSIASLMMFNSSAYAIALESPIPLPSTIAPDPIVAPPSPASTPKPASEPTQAATPKPASTPKPSVADTPTPQPTLAPTPLPSASPVTNLEDSGNQNGGGNTNVDSIIDTSDATVTGAVTNTGNTNSSQLLPSPSGGGASVVNSTNGNGSNSSATVQDSISSSTAQSNSATIVNSMNQVATTGQNTNNSNTGGSTTINTGNANNSGQIVNMVNTNAAAVNVSEFNITDNHMGDFILNFADNCTISCGGNTYNALNNANGSGSTNSAIVDSQNSTATFQNNNAGIINDMTLVANTGDNSIDRNTSSNAAITTGNANVSAGISTFANNNLAGNVYFGTVNIFGSLNGDIVFPEGFVPATNANQTTNISNSNNGDGSTNQASLLSSNDYTLSQSNDLNLINNINIIAETGSNETDRNTGGINNVETGDANLFAQVVNIANNNILSGDIFLVIVNEAGNWIGRILGAPEGANFAASDGVGVSANGNGEINVANNGNGEGSLNSASVNQSTESFTEQSNNANIINNVNLVANTGKNSTSRNTGGENSIETGDANVILNIVNFVNNNIASNSRLFVVLVNVFGSWNGDFVSPGQTKEADNSSGTGGVDIPSGNQPSNSSSASSSSNDSEGSGNETPSVLATMSTVNYSSVPRGKSAIAGKIASGEQTESKSLDITPEVNAASDNEGSANSLNINLAWGLLLIPVYLLARIVRKRYLQ